MTTEKKIYIISAQEKNEKFECILQASTEEEAWELFKTYIDEDRSIEEIEELIKNGYYQIEDEGEINVRITKKYPRSEFFELLVMIGLLVGISVGIAFRTHIFILSWINVILILWIGWYLYLIYGKKTHLYYMNLIMEKCKL